MMIHVASSIIWILQMQLPIWKHMELVAEMSAILMIISSFFVFMQQFRVLSLLGEKADDVEFLDRPVEFIYFHFWVELEVLFAFSIVCANSLFLMLRFCFKNKIKLAPSEYLVK